MSCVTSMTVMVYTMSRDRTALARCAAYLRESMLSPFTIATLHLTPDLMIAFFFFTKTHTKGYTLVLNIYRDP